MPQFSAIVFLRAQVKTPDLQPPISANLEWLLAIRGQATRLVPL